MNAEDRTEPVAGRPPLHWVCLGYDRLFGTTEIAALRAAKPAWVVTNTRPHLGARTLDTDLLPAHVGPGPIGLVLALVRGTTPEHLAAEVVARVNAAVATAGGPDDLVPLSSACRRAGP